MDDYNELTIYNGESEHDMWVDFSNNESTGELDDIFDNPDVENINSGKYI